ncbi:hypothetical protein B0T14DRAFT_434055, partial [Immersiella caudata]
KSTLRLRTLLTLGALLQTLLFALLPSHLALIPTLIIAFYAAVTTLAHILSPEEAPLLHDVIPGRATALISSWHTGGFTSSGNASAPLVVFHVVLGINHPLGWFSEGGREVMAAMEGLFAVMDMRREEFGLVGWSKWSGMEREVSGKVMVVGYSRGGGVSLVHESFEIAPGRWGFAAVDSVP